MNNMASSNIAAYRPSVKEISKVPDNSNPETRATEKQLGPFKFDDG